MQRLLSLVLTMVVLAPCYAGANDMNVNSTTGGTHPQTTPPVNQGVGTTTTPPEVHTTVPGGATGTGTDAGTSGTTSPSGTEPTDSSGEGVSPGASTSPSTSSDGSSGTSTTP